MFLTDPNDDLAAERAARHAAICQELLQLGMQAIRQTAADMQSPPEAKPAPDLHARFDKLARCIRQTMLLENQIADARRSIVTKTIQLEKDRVFARSFSTNTTPETAPTRPERPERVERLQRDRFPKPPTEDEFPSLLATVSQEIGIDLTDPATFANLPKPQARFEPPPD